MEAHALYCNGMLKMKKKDRDSYRLSQLSENLDRVETFERSRVSGVSFLFDFFDTFEFTFPNTVFGTRSSFDAFTDCDSIIRKQILFKELHSVGNRKIGSFQPFQLARKLMKQV